MGKLAGKTDMGESAPCSKMGRAHVSCAGNVCVSAFGDARHFRAKTRKRAAKRENAKTAKTAKTRTEVQERESWTAMIISGSSGTSMQNNYIALQ